MSQKKEIRRKFREGVFKRDKFVCQICGAKYSLEQSDPALQIINAHHITDRNELDNGGYCVENGITVCDEKGNYPGSTSCHMLVESWHISGGDLNMVEPQYRPEALYQKIGSSLELARKRAKALK